MTYAPPLTDRAFVRPPEETEINVPAGVSASQFAFVDLYGEGLPGILVEQERAWYYKANSGGGHFGQQVIVEERPSTTVGNYGLGDFNSNGDTDCSRFLGRLAGYFELDRDELKWKGFQPFHS